MDGSVRFTNVGILEFARPKFSEYLLLESDDEEENNKNFSSSNNVTPSRSSYYSTSSGSSDCTPVSITNELTNVEEDEDTLRVFPNVENTLPIIVKSTISSSNTITSPVSFGPFLPDGKFSAQEEKSRLSKSTLNGSAAAVQKQSPVERSSSIPPPQNQASSLFIDPTTNNNSNTSIAASSSAQNDLSSSIINKRKRLLSDRGERELEYPVCDQRTSISSWRGCSFLKGKLCGVGLCNYSNDCFLNSVLQSIVHTAKLARFLVESQDPRHCLSDRICFSCALRRYILRAVNVNKPFEASWIRQYLPKFFPSHRHGHQEDAHEMLTLLLSALDPPLTNKNGAALGAYSSANKDKFSMVPSSPIEQIFGGNLRNQIRCDVCGTLHTNYEKIREINLGLVRNIRTRVIDLVHDFFKAEQLQCFMCKTCKCKRNATRSTTILRAPSVLIVQLKRFNLFGGKNRSLVLPDLCLNLKKFSFNDEPIEYCLNGIIEHIGTGVNFGHYVSAWRGFDERSWFYFDDSEVYPMSEQKVESMEPYILFYNRVVTAKAGNNGSATNSGRSYSNGKIQQPNGFQQRSFMTAFSPSNGGRNALNCRPETTADNGPQLKRPCLSPSIPTASHSAGPSNNDQVVGKNSNGLINHNFGYRNGSASSSNGGMFSFKLRKSLPTAMTPRSLLNLNGNQSGSGGINSSSVTTTSTPSTSSNVNNGGPKKIELDKKASTNRFFKPFTIR